MTTEKDSDLKKLMETAKCSRNFKCYKAGFKDITPAHDIGLEGFVKCESEDSLLCPHSFNFGYSRFCRCPIIVYAVKELGV